MFNSEVLQQCRETDLFSLMLRVEPERWSREGRNYIRNKEHKSCIVTSGKGWVWNSQGKKGRNALDFLILFYGFSFREAVKCIICNTNLNIQERISEQPSKAIAVNLPPKAKMPWVKLYDYLCVKRKVKKYIIDYLISENLLYLTEGNYQNICFKNYSDNHCEIVGITSKRFKQISDSERYWSFGKYKNKAYICESAIDAISLFQILKDRQSTYISIGGSSSREKLIRKICDEFDEVILAVDNDSAGEKVAMLFPKLKRIIPKSKDWNMDLGI